ncbi:uncharacterized protein LODBEIA_P44320 [Lodderomyces beijingensis]|uniref:WH2 domain-containing protein n=1 Tax=Lodderomyces beijingensis TaxID=1775926 RepID=A0ABP0ZPX0_9ASCO
MMAHEIGRPIEIQSINDNRKSFQNKMTSNSSNVKKKNSGEEGNSGSGAQEAAKVRLLPSGNPVDFGNGTKDKSPRKSKPPPIKLSSLPSLPNGEKPNFQPLRDTFVKKKQSRSNKEIAKASLPSGEKPNFNNEASTTKSKKPGNGKQSKEKGVVAVGPIEDVTYAGSSFHSSPAALNLPKPKFKTSPKQVESDGTGELSKSFNELASLSETSPAGSLSAVSSVGSPSLQKLQRQQTPQSQQPLAAAPPPPPPSNSVTAAPPPPPSNSVTAYPPGSLLPQMYQQQQPQQPQHLAQGYAPSPHFIQPGFAYHVNPNGFISYPPQQPIYPGPFSHQPHQHSQPQPQAQQAHSFPHHPQQQPIFTHYMTAPPMMQHPKPQQPQQPPQPQQLQQEQNQSGQKITFNDLLSSSK